MASVPPVAAVGGRISVRVGSVFCCHPNNVGGVHQFMAHHVDGYVQSSRFLRELLRNSGLCVFSSTL